MVFGFYTETLEDLVFYKELGEEKFWARPLDMFKEYVPGTDQLRFKFIGNN